MKERILRYRKKIDELLNNDSKDVNWRVIIDEHLIQVGFFQHERLVHLIVTVTFALLLMLAVVAFLITEAVQIIFLCIAFLVLLVPYISHYYLLENETQKMYVQYDKMLEKLK